MSAADHRVWEEELAAYVLGALDAAEQDAVEAHIAGCERCRADLRWIGAAMEVLPASVEQREPPARLRRSLFAAVRAEGGAAGQAPAASSGWRDSLARALRPGLAYAVVAVLAVGGVAGYVVSQSGGGDEVTVTARATDAAPAGAEATVVRDGDAGMLRTSGLPQPDGGEVYQVWIRDGETITPSTVFVVDRSGAGVAAIPAGLEDGDEVMVTREPRGGSAVPTTAPLLRAPLG
ncbi:MAG TPA: anti-sigma factor [Solirubrobacterales bacterium]|nr:anti-sigma factor [Solirubrobacterales bacterium]